MALLPYADEGGAEDERVRELLERVPARLNVFRMLANSPAVAGPALRLGGAILGRGELDPALRELVILSTAKLTDTEYEWVQHVPIARHAGVTDEQIAALERGDRSALAPGVELAAQALDGTPDEALVRQVAAELGTAATIELVLVAGYYAMLAMMMRTVRLDVDGPVDPGALT